jgi:carboxy-cis,cis-muconate cyclase
MNCCREGVFFFLLLTLVFLQKEKLYFYATSFNTTPSSFHSFLHSRDGNKIIHTNTVSGFKCTGNPMFIIADPNPPNSVYGSFYHDGAGCEAVLGVTEIGNLDGSITQELKLQPNSGVKGMAFNPVETDVVYSADTLANRIWTHRKNATTGALTRVGELVVSPESSAPRHIVIHPSGKYLYTVDEESSLVQEYVIDGQGLPEATGTNFSVLGPGQSKADFRAVEIQLSASGKLMWASNRGRRADIKGWLAVYTLAADGHILQQAWTGQTKTSGGLANAVSPAPWSDGFVALTDSEKGFVQIWKLDEGPTGDAFNLGLVAQVDISDGGCCANVIWYS